jgi:hypothetical protein
MNDRRATAVQNTIIVAYATPVAVKHALSEIRKSGCKVSLSVFVKDEDTTNLRESDRSDFLVPLRECLSGWTSLAIPDIGHAQISGPMSAWMVAVLDNAAMFSGLDPLGACLHCMGIASEAIPNYEAAVRAGRILLLAHGASEEVVKAREILSRDNAWVGG